jgi:hypothetical protein
MMEAEAAVEASCAKKRTMGNVQTYVGLAVSVVQRYVELKNIDEYTQFFLRKYVPKRSDLKFGRRGREVLPKRRSSLRHYVNDPFETAFRYKNTAEYTVILDLFSYLLNKVPTDMTSLFCVHSEQTSGRFRTCLLTDTLAGANHLPPSLLHAVR